MIDSLLQWMISTIRPGTNRILLIDGIGALLTTLFLAFLLAPWEELFGMPRKAVYVLSVIAFGFTLFSTAAYLFAGNQWRLYLKIIRTANLAYCFLSLVLVIYYYDRIRWMGMLYFTLEIILIILLVILEFKSDVEVREYERPESKSE